MKLLAAATVLSVVFSATAAHAFGDTIVVEGPKQSAYPGSYFIENVPVKQHPYDSGNLNQSPIRGKGAFKVVHSEPVPGDPDAAVIKAIQLLQDNGYRIYRPR